MECNKTMEILRNNCVPLTCVTVYNNNKSYRVTGSPNVIQDKYPMVEVWVCETFQTKRHFTHPTGKALVSDRYGHWRRLPHSGPVYTTAVKLARGAKA